VTHVRGEVQHWSKRIKWTLFTPASKSREIDIGEQANHPRLSMAGEEWRVNDFRVRKFLKASALRGAVGLGAEPGGDPSQANHRTKGATTFHWASIDRRPSGHGSRLRPQPLQAPHPVTNGALAGR